MIVRLMVVLCATLFSAPVSWGGPFEDCILQNMKGVQAQGAAQAIYRACKEKTTPKKCRDAILFEGKIREPDELNIGPVLREMTRDKCFKECASASWLSRTFGECRTD